MEGMDSLLVLIGSNWIPDEPRQPTLVIDAQADHLELLRMQKRQCVHYTNLTWKQAVLSSKSNEGINWFRFNDARLDGTVTLEQWRNIYPNLQLIGQETHSAQTLADLLSDWPIVHDNQQNINLIISQGNPVQILEGAGTWITRFQRIRLASPRAADLWEECCDAWLQQQGFRPDPNIPLCWILDTQTAKLIQQRADAENRSSLYAEELQDLKCKQNILLKALHHVFPYGAYRKVRPDLSAFTEPQLVEHFVTHGINEGINLKSINLESELQKLIDERTAEAARLELLNEKSRHTAQQLELLKDLLARLMVIP